MSSSRGDSVFCRALVWSIAFINLAITFRFSLTDKKTSLTDNEISLVETGFPYLDESTLDYITYFSYAITVYVSIMAIFSPVLSSRSLIYPLYSWDVIRLFFTLWSLTLVPSTELWFRFLLYSVLLLFCILVYMYYISLLMPQYVYMNFTDMTQSDATDSSITDPIAYNHQFNPFPTLPTISEECEVHSSQSRFFTRHLPQSRFVDTAPPAYSSLDIGVAPPPYSSVQPSSPSIAVLPATTFSTNDQDGSVGAAFSPADLPPPYECSENSPNSLKSYVELQQPINLRFFSALMSSKALKIEPIDH